MNQEDKNVRERLLAVAVQLASTSESVRRSKLKQLNEQGVNVGRLPIVPIAKASGGILSYAQMRQWFLWKLDPASTAYHITGGLRLNGPLDVEALRASFAAIVARHETLRTVFRERGEGAVEQVIFPVWDVKFPVVDFEAVEVTQRETELAALARNIWEQPFDLENGPLYRISLARLTEDKHVLIVAMHHIVSDGWSMQIILRELANGYNARIRGHIPQFEPLPIRYADYAIWQRNWLEAGEAEWQLGFWSKHLGQEHPILELPVDHPGARNGRYRAAHHAVEIPPSLVSSLRKTVQGAGATLFMGLLAAFEALLQRYTGQDDLRVGVPVANRNRAETADIVGFFVNTLVLRGQVMPTQSLDTVLGNVRAEVLAAQSHQDLPFEMLVEALHPERTLNRTPLFQVMFNYEKEDLGRFPQLQSVEVNEYAIGDVAAQFELTLNCREDETGRVFLRFTYAKELFEPATIERMAGHYMAVLHALTEVPEQAIGELNLLSEREREELTGWGVNKERCPEARPVHRLIESQVKARPQATALVFGEEELSYAELNARSNRLANRLIGLG
ncbi:MAG: condensation domain-containing protein, partial [Azoarcus sp.]|nr:condensation domain-containing protein [Azoarcus sp.]